MSFVVLCLDSVIRFSSRQSLSVCYIIKFPSSSQFWNIVCFSVSLSLINIIYEQIFWVSPIEFLTESHFICDLDEDWFVLSNCIIKLLFPWKTCWHKLNPNIFTVHMTLQYYFDLSSLFSTVQSI